MSTRTEIIENLDRCWTSSSALAAGLSADQWASPSLCPDWTVQGVFAHLTAIEEVLLGWWPTEPSDPPPFAAIPKIHAELSGAPTDTVVERFTAAVGLRRAELATMDDTAFATSCMTPVGPGTYGRFMAIRVFDCWIHERDIRVPLGLPADDAGPPAEMALDEVRGSLGYIVGKKIGLAEGEGIVFELTGPVDTRLLVKVDGRANVVDELVDPDVTLTTDSLTFMLLACGRIDPEAAVADGRIIWTGNDVIGGRAARNLRFTM
jgi:uncharacterized protein (TIGR03083 family)